nr:uncharacterized protein LOC128683009 [Plodia interpunctella]
MVVFEPLPDIELCCFYLPLRLGCFIIGVWYLLVGNIGNHYPLYFGIEQSTCYERLYDVNCPQSIVLKSPLRSMITLIWFLHTLGFFASVVFIVGIAIEHVLCISFFMYVFTITKVFDVLVFMTLFILGMTSAYPCNGSVLGMLNCFTTILVTVLLTIYLVMVIKSYRSSIDM